MLTRVPSQSKKYPHESVGAGTINGVLAGTTRVVAAGFLIKIIATAVTLETGGSGGIVTPIFFIGATSGAARATLFGVPPGLLASFGFVSVLAGAANTPIAAADMAMELLPANEGVYAALAAVMAFLMSSQALQEGTLFAGYSIVRELGHGSMATVYLAEDLKHHRQVALKLLKPNLGTSIEAARLFREIEIAATLTHPNILPLHDSGNEHGRLYYVMPYVDGGSLRERLLCERQLPVQEAVRLAHEVADALAYAHERGVVHRDIKPENILLQQGHPVVVDFGVARALSALDQSYATGEITVDHRADQYALACVLYEMLAGNPPFVGGNVRGILARQVADPPPPLTTVRPGIPGAVRQAVMRGLAKTPADRFSTTREFAEALVAAPGHATPCSSFAVLPFVNLGGNAEDEYFGDGMAEEIITALAKIQGLHVVSPTSAFAFKDRHLDIRAIGDC